MKLSIIIPVYNEEKTVEALLRKVNGVRLSDGTTKEIIVVNDGSTDGTVNVLNRLKSELNFILLQMDKNRGKGSAIREGIKHVTGDYTVIQDADLEYDPQDLNNILSFAMQNNSPVVYGSRRLLKGNSQYAALAFYIGGVFLSWLTNVLYAQNITDEPTCYKMFKTDLIKSLPLTCERFEFCPEVTALIAKKGIKIPEVPINYYPRNVQEGKKINWKDGLQAAWTLVKFRF
ncbi:MAG: glycosyltransferase family 2 protein [Patescibacteria group bacterium]|nr:glycosyltransferase family 2 protein [Patescibacteria group bacterium]